MTSTSASSRKNQALSKIACNRLQKELVEWLFNPPAGFKHKPTDNLQRWVIEAKGDPGTLYSNETFQLQVDFPEHYPMEAPLVHFSCVAYQDYTFVYDVYDLFYTMFLTLLHISGWGFTLWLYRGTSPDVSDGSELTKYIALGYKSCIERRSKQLYLYSRMVHVG